MLMLIFFCKTNEKCWNVTPAYLVAYNIHFVYALVNMFARVPFNWWMDELSSVSASNANTEKILENDVMTGHNEIRQTENEFFFPYEVWRHNDINSLTSMFCYILFLLICDFADIILKIFSLAINHFV